MNKEDGSLYLTEEELAQWREALQGVKPYDAPPMLPATPTQKTRTRPTVSQSFHVPLPKQRGSQVPLVAGAFAGVDKGTVRKIKRGQWPIDSRIDLHGMTKEQAFMALQRHVMQALLQHQRLVLVITGKGSLSEGGVLRSALPGWLNDEALRPYLLAFDSARREDGGSGAFYLLLKKLVGTAI